MTFQVRPIAIAVAILLSGAASSSFAQEVRRPYIVQLQAEPAATYKGDVAGLAATQPAPGAAFDYHSVKVQEYVRYLGGRKAEVLATIANAPVLADYDVVVNGFSAMLTDAEVLALKNNAAVVDVQADQARAYDTVTTSAFLGLSKSGGLWSQYAGGALVKGEDMVVGIVDGGIWPENPAFADRVDADGKPTFDANATLAYTTAPVTFKGGCMAGEGFDPLKHCNNKLIGAKFFNAGFLASGQTLNWSDYVSPRDSNIGSNGVSTGHGGHGDHTASTAAGNANNPVTLGGAFMGLASGMAPRARVSAYKICWTYDNPAEPDGTRATNSCYNTDAVSAIDAAVKDGVNVINYSISGSQTSSNDVVEAAFYRASLANVFVAASAGNSGPANAVAHISPWLTTVAASTHDRFYVADVTLANNAKYTGASVNSTPLGSTPMIRAEDAGLGGGNASLCYSSGPVAPQVMLDPAKVAGKIVVCTRGSNGRVDKSQAVLNAGGVGMVLADNGAGLVSEVHAVPTVHVSQADGNAIKAYVVAQGAAARGSIGTFYNQPKPAPIMASFSSRGPNMGDPNVLKPDLTAPGVDVIASVTPALNAAQHNAVADGSLVPPGDFASYQGTSMSSPHVAGVALLLRQAHPTWSPAAIKSALMTSAYTTLNDGVAGASNGLLPWSQGAGHIDPNKATDPGLVYDAGKADYVQYNCKVNKAAVTPATDCSVYGTLDETYNLNLPSITVNAVQGTTTVRRTVTNVGSTTATYTGAVSVPGFNATVSPASLTLAPGASGAFQVQLTGNGAATNVWQFGSLSWNDGSHAVRIPVSARVGVAVTSPAEITSDKTTGSKSFLVKTGYSGVMPYAKGGLKEATLSDVVSMTAGPLDSAGLQAACAAGVSTASVHVYPVTVPANTVVARFALFQQDSNARDDHDLGVLTPSGTWIYSGNDGSNEFAQIASPAAGNYKVCVDAYGSNVEAMKHRLNSWIVTRADIGGKLVLAVPGKVVAGYNTIVGMSWAGLEQGKRYLGAAQFMDAGSVVRATSVLRIETGAASIPTGEVAKSTPAKTAAR
jgi:subtilisin family serine protease